MNEHRGGTSEQHYAFVVEVPALYTADIDELRKVDGDWQSESEFLLNCCGQPGPVRLRLEGLTVNDILYSPPLNANDFGKETGLPFTINIVSLKDGKFQATLKTDRGQGVAIGDTIEEAITVADAAYEGKPS